MPSFLSHDDFRATCRFGRDSEAPHQRRSRTSGRAGSGIQSPPPFPLSLACRPPGGLESLPPPVELLPRPAQLPLVGGGPLPEVGGGCGGHRGSDGLEYTRIRDRADGQGDGRTDQPTSGESEKQTGRRTDAGLPHWDGRPNELTQAWTHSEGGNTRTARRTSKQPMGDTEHGVANGVPMQSHGALLHSPPPRRRLRISVPSGRIGDGCLPDGRGPAAVPGGVRKAPLGPGHIHLPLAAVLPCPGQAAGPH